MRRLWAITAILTFVLFLAYAPVPAQQQTEKPRELEVFGQYVGDWTSSVTSRPAAWTPQKLGYRTSNHAEFVLDGWFLQHVEVNHVVGDPGKVTKSLFLWTYDPNSRQYIGWAFQSTGNISKVTGTWDLASRTLTCTVADPPPNTTGKLTERFETENSIQGALLFTGDDGRTLFDMVWTRTREKGLVPNPLREQWATISTPIQPIPEELQKFEVFVGTRDVEFVHRPSAVSPRGSATRGTAAGRWILDGRFLLGQTDLGRFQSLWVMGYDTNAKAFRYVLFGSNGRMEENIGDWNEAGRVFDWKQVNGPPGFTRTSTTRRTGDDTVESRMVTKTQDGTIHMDLTIKATQRR